MVKKSSRAQDPVAEDVQAALLELERMSTKRDRDNLARFGITATRPFGVSMANLKLLAKRLGRNHELAAALWETGRYEARMLATLVDEPARVTPAQMERWRRRLRQLGHLRHGVLRPLRSDAACVGQGRGVVRPARGVRQARRLRAHGLPRAARQGRA